jgi:thermitase
MNKFSMMGSVSLALISSLALGKVATEKVLFMPGEVLVKVKTGFESSFVTQLSQLDMSVKKELKLLTGDYFLVSSHSKSTTSLVTSLENLSEVEFAEPNFIYKSIGFESNLQSVLSGVMRSDLSSHSATDPMYSKLWGLHNTGSNEPDRSGNQSPVPGVFGADIQAQKAWPISRGSKKIVVAVIDTGIDYNHEDLKENLWMNSKEIAGNGIDDDNNGYIDDVYGWNAQLNNGNPMDGNGHGTHCAGTIGAVHNNGLGVAGVMKDVQMMAVKFLSDQGSGTLADAVEAIDYATKMNVDIMSNSWGGGGFSQALFNSIEAAKNKGIIFVAAAGNDNSNNDTRASYPSSYQIDNVISVASHTAQDTVSSFSNFGKRTVHVIAPGSNVLSTTPQNTYKVYSGTSMATPHASGVVGLLLAKTGRLPVLEVRERLMATSVPVSTYTRKVSASGRVSAYNFLTNTRIPRNEPNDTDWRVESLTEVFETEHPYKDNQNFSKTYSFPGAKFVRLVIEKYDTERNYDFITIKDQKGNVVEKISGAGTSYETDYLEGDSITVEFSSDSSQVKWGVLVREAKVIY